MVKCVGSYVGVYDGLCVGLKNELHVGVLDGFEIILINLIGQSICPRKGALLGWLYASLLENLKNSWRICRFFVGTLHGVSVETDVVGFTELLIRII